MSKVLIKNARILDPASGLDKNGAICIEEGRIKSLATPASRFKPDVTIDAGGKWACPGIIDLSARFGKPGHDIRKQISSEMKAAASAGVTTVCTPPDIQPVIDSTAIVESLHTIASEKALVKLLPIAALTQGLEGDRLAEMYTLKKAGCVAVSNAGLPMANNEIFRRALEYAASTGLTVFVHPVDHQLQNRGVVNEGVMSTRLGLPPVPVTAETVALSTTLLLIEQSGTRTHFCRLSTAQGVEMLRQAKKSGLPVSADVDICHLFLTELDVDGYNTSCYLDPPLRSMEDRNALIEGLKDGVIDAVCSDHRLLSADSKIAPFSLASPGASTIEMLLPLVLDLAGRCNIPILKSLSLLTENPATVLGIKSGRIEQGAPADIILVDPEKQWKVAADTLVSASKCTPFEDWQMTGKTTHTFLDGKLVFQDDR